MSPPVWACFILKAAPEGVREGEADNLVKTIDLVPKLGLEPGRVFLPTYP